MAEARKSRFSISLPAEIGRRVQLIAHLENLSNADVVQTAVEVFTSIPKELRDLLVRATTETEAGGKQLKELALVIMYQEAVRRLDEGAAAAAKHFESGHDQADYDDAIVVERR